MSAILRGLARELRKWRPARQHQSEAHAPRYTDRSLGRARKQDRRVRLLYRMREQFVLAIDLEAKVLALVIGALGMEEVQQQRQGFLLNVTPPFEVYAKPIELVFAIAGAKPQREAAAAQHVDKGSVFHHAQRVCERQPRCQS
jgi:hypothetical protein